MKKSIKWLSAIALLIMGAFMFVSCGDDEDDGPSSKKTQVSDLASAIIGSWYVIPQNTDERIEIDVISFYENGNGAFAESKAKANNNWQIQSFASHMTYTLNGNHLKMDIQGEIREGDVYLYTDGTGEVRYVDDGKTETMPLYRMAQSQNIQTVMEDLIAKKNNGNDNGDDNGNEGGLIQGGDVKATEVVGTWFIAQTSDTNINANTITFTKDGTGSMGNLTFTYSNEWQDNRIKCYIRFSNDVYTECKLIVVQNGNVLNGECQDNGGDWEMLVLQKPDYTIPSEGILGRWKITGPRELDNMDEGPKVGMVLVFGQNGELYIEGDPHYSNYALDNTTLKLTIKDRVMEGGFEVGNMVSGAKGTWTGNVNGREMTIELEKQ